MPELPEVETIRRQLAPLVEGRTLERVEVLDARWSRPLAPRELADALAGRRVRELGRRGKYLLWHLDGDVHLAQHLRMTGSILVEPDPEPLHTRVRVTLGPPVAGATGVGPRRLVVVDPRRFGTGELLLGGARMDEFLAARLGLEPFDAGFTGPHLRAIMRGRRAPVKAILLDQRRVAGVGNIYADEALFRAGIHPLRPAGRLSGAQCARLRDAVVEVLEAGIEAKGASIDDFRHVDGVQGSFQDRFRVYQRAGMPCLRCATVIEKTVVAGRGTYVCPSCQPRPRRVRPRAGAAQRGVPAGG